MQFKRSLSDGSIAGDGVLNELTVQPGDSTSGVTSVTGSAVDISVHGTYVVDFEVQVNLSSVGMRTVSITDSSGESSDQRSWDAGTLPRTNGSEVVRLQTIVDVAENAPRQFTFAFAQDSGTDLYASGTVTVSKVSE